VKLDAMNREHVIAKLRAHEGQLKDARMSVCRFLAPRRAAMRGRIPMLICWPRSMRVAEYRFWILSEWN
jgi:hypothetical protein